jgi:hypothetical protein
MNAADRWSPLTELLQALLERITGELPGCVGAGLAAGYGGRPPRVLATAGVAADLLPAQLAHGGPVTVAAGTGDAVFTSRAELAEVRGAAALPGFWDDGSAFVLSATFDRPPGAGIVGVLRRYEKLTELTLVVAETATTGDPDQTLDLLASRAAIEQAKGAVMAVRRCGPDEAWQTLRRASQEFNVKVRELAVALVEHLGGRSAPPSGGVPEIRPGAAARHAAERLWSAFTTE